MALGSRTRLPAAAAGWAKSIDPRLLRHEVEGVHRLGSLGYQTGPSEPQLTTSGRATCTRWLLSKHTTGGVTMCDFKARRSPRAHLDTALRKLLRKLRPPARSQGASDILADRRVRVCHVEKATTGGQDRCRPRRYLASSMVILTALYLCACLPARDPMRPYYDYTFQGPQPALRM